MLCSTVHGCLACVNGCVRCLVESRAKFSFEGLLLPRVLVVCRGLFRRGHFYGQFGSLSTTPGNLHMDCGRVWSNYRSAQIGSPRWLSDNKYRGLCAIRSLLNSIALAIQEAACAPQQLEAWSRESSQAVSYIIAHPGDQARHSWLLPLALYLTVHIFGWAWWLSHCSFARTPNDTHRLEDRMLRENVDNAAFMELL